MAKIFILTDDGRSIECPNAKLLNFSTSSGFNYGPIAADADLSLYPSTPHITVEFEGPYIMKMDADPKGVPSWLPKADKTIKKAEKPEINKIKPGTFGNLGIQYVKLSGVIQGATIALDEFGTAYTKAEEKPKNKKIEITAKELSSGYLNCEVEFTDKLTLETITGIYAGEAVKEDSGKIHVDLFEAKEMCHYLDPDHPVYVIKKGK